MKLEKLAIGLSFIAMSLGGALMAQDGDDECTRMRFLAGEDVKINNFKGAVKYYIKAEKICGEFDKANYQRLYGSLKNVINAEADVEIKKAYVDTIIGVFNRAEAKGFLPADEKLSWGSYVLQSSNPDSKLADKLLTEGKNTAGDKIDEGYLIYYYYNVTSLFTGAKDPKEKESVKQRIILEYFDIIQLMNDKKMSTLGQEYITNYFNSVVSSCDDVLPSLKGFMKQLPQDKTVKISLLKNFLQLLESKECTSSKEYSMIIDSLILLDPTSTDTKLIKIKMLSAQSKYSEANTLLREVRDISDDAVLKEKIDYEILINTFRSGAYSAAWKMGMNINGKYRGEALKIAAQSVAQMAGGCGNTTVERKATYIYADEIMDKARAAGTSGQSFKSNYPTKQDLFDAGMEVGQSVSLTCFGVSVNLKTP